ncbi:hypothetical protein MBLNU457_2039t1 [Dothideomycetes sp. NU457]
MSLKRKQPSQSSPSAPPPPPPSSNPASPSSPSPSNSIFTSEALHDRESIFQGYFSPTLSPKELQSHDDLASASHRILAARLPSSKQKTLSGTPIISTTTDDDGEKYGAKRVLSVLEAEKVIGTLVVARWYGGVMLGPVRFTHMETVGREAIAAWRTWEAEQREGERRAKAEAFEKERLVKELRERDESVVALRGLLDLKNGGSTPSVAAKKVMMEYEAMELSRLRMLDKARDSTIAFLLKQIDAAEKKGASSSQLEAEVQDKRNATKTDVVLSPQSEKVGERSIQAEENSLGQGDGSPPAGNVEPLSQSDLDGRPTSRAQSKVQVEGVSEAELDELASIGNDVDEV